MEQWVTGGGIREDGEHPKIVYIEKQELRFGMVRSIGWRPWVS
jgi:hypothetical protein